ncbi:MAG: hypothetical protein P9M07_08160 [Candidatus Aceula meridiana]|nr:hypothetical protein [Candidatus Aceula meridiana]
MKKTLISLGLFVFAGVASATLVFAQGSVTLTTYYPAPFGKYQDMRVMEKLGVGTDDTVDLNKVRKLYVKEDNAMSGVLSKFYFTGATNDSWAMQVAQGGSAVIDPSGIGDGALYLSASTPIGFPASDPGFGIYEERSAGVQNFFGNPVGIGGTIPNDDLSNVNLYVNGSVGIKKLDPDSLFEVNPTGIELIPVGGKYPSAFVGSGLNGLPAFVAAATDRGTSLPAGNIGLFATTGDATGSAAYFRGDVEMESGNIALNGGYLSGDGGNEGVLVSSDGNVTIPGYNSFYNGASRPDNLEVTGDLYATATIGGKLGIRTGIPTDQSSAALQVGGDDAAHKGRVGINRSTPVVSLDVNGAIKVGSENPGVCTAALAGTMKFTPFVNYSCFGGGSVNASTLRICSTTDGGTTWYWFQVHGDWSQSCAGSPQQEL